MNYRENLGRTEFGLCIEHMQNICLYSAPVIKESRYLIAYWLEYYELKRSLTATLT